MEEFQGLWEMVVAWLLVSGVNILIAAAIFVLGRWMATRLSRLVEKAFLRLDVDPILSTFLKNLIYYTLLVSVALAALGQLGVQTTSFLAIVGTAGLAIGLALKDNLSNLAAGVMLLFSRPFNLGDVVEVAGVKGKVRAINIFDTILNTPDNQKIILPNAQIMGSTIVNMTANPTRRVDLVIGIGYDDDLGKAKKVLQQLIGREARILKDPAPVVAVSELGDSSVNLVVRPWVRTEDYWDVYYSLVENIKQTFDEEGISFPFPQRDVHVFSHSESAGSLR